LVLLSEDLYISLIQVSDLLRIVQTSDEAPF